LECDIQFGTKKKNQEKTHVWVFWDGEWVFALKWVILYVELRKMENIQNHETQDQSPTHPELLNEFV